MGSPCEVLCETDVAGEADELAGLAAAEAWRVEDKFSRYLRGNIVDRINNADGQALQVDRETANLLDFADTLYTLSDGAFDITSGVLRRVWSFDGSDRLPSHREVETVLQAVGWPRVSWTTPTIQMPAGMEIDLGGLGKEYAVDSAAGLLRNASQIPCLVNFGGDLAVTGPPLNKNAWVVGVEGATDSQPDTLINLRDGALATSGNSKQFLLKNGIRYSHVLDPRTGWPVTDAATSITVAADTCSQAGMLSTLAMLKGPMAEAFLRDQTEQYWCRR